jgi:hypothetical protein
MNQGIQHPPGTLLGMGGYSQLSRRVGQLIPCQLIDGIPVLRTEGIPQAIALIVGPQLSDLYSDDPGVGQSDMDLMSLVIDMDLSTLVQVDSREDLAGHHHQGALG